MKIALPIVAIIIALIGLGFALACYLSIKETIVPRLNDHAQALTYQLQIDSNVDTEISMIEMKLGINPK